MNCDMIHIKSKCQGKLTAARRGGRIVYCCENALKIWEKIGFKNMGITFLKDDE